MTTSDKSSVSRLSTLTLWLGIGSIFLCGLPLPLVIIVGIIAIVLEPGREARVRAITGMLVSAACLTPVFMQAPALHRPFIILFAVWLVWCLNRLLMKRWRQFLAVAVIPPAAVAAFLVFALFYTYLERTTDAQLFNADADVHEATFAYHSDRSFTGDGYSIVEYKLPQAIRERFLACDEKLLTEFPQHGSNRNGWSTSYWKRGPFDAAQQKFIGFALGISEPEVSDVRAKVLDALSKPTTFYAFFYKKNDDRVSDIDFFVVDLENNRVYMINSNT